MWLGGVSAHGQYGSCLLQPSPGNKTKTHSHNTHIHTERISYGTEWRKQEKRTQQAREQNNNGDRAPVKELGDLLMLTAFSTFLNPHRILWLHWTSIKERWCHRIVLCEEQTEIKLFIQWKLSNLICVQKFIQKMVHQCTKFDICWHKNIINFSKDCSSQSYWMASVDFKLI